MDTTTKTTNYNNADLTKYYSGRQTVGALFQNRSDAEKAINELKAHGFRGDQIGVALRDRTAQDKLVEDTGSKAGGAATSGALGGGLLGGVLGFLIGVGALAIPGIGPVVSAGVLTAVFGTVGATTLAGAGIGAATGGVVGALVGMGIPEHEAKYLDAGFRKGSTLVTVNATTNISDAVNILQQYGGDLGVTTTNTADMKTVR